jgi:nucleoside-diphosphate-sugar epimerase
MKKILVTGSSGTVGTAVCSALLERDYSVIGVDLKPNNFSPEVQKHTRLVDMREREQVVSQLPKDCDAIIHLGANARVPHSIKNPTLARDNIEATFNMLELARQTPGCAFIFASSKDVYGNHNSTKEDSVQIEYCESPYGASKIACEALVFAYQKSYEIPFSILRLSNVYGRFSEPDRVIPIFARLTRNNQTITVKGADKVLDFVHVDDVVEAFLLVLTQFETAKNQVFNLASGSRNNC